MPTLTGTLADVTGDELDPADIRSVSVRAPAERPSLTGGDVLIVSAPVDLARSGVLSVALEPGPAVLVVVTDASHDVYELHVTADMTLLSEALAESSPDRSWVESVMVQLRGEAVAAAAAASKKAGEAGASASAAATARDEAVAAKLVWRGPWAAGTQYATRDVVSHGGSSWWALRPSTGVTPVEGADWSLLASRGAPGASDWSAITGKPDTFPSSPHRHGMGEVDGLDTTLATKADLDGDGKLAAAQLPAIAVVEFRGTVAAQAAMLALVGQKGDWCIRTDTGTSWIITGDNPTQVSSWTQLPHPADAVSSVAGRTGAVTLSRADVGLSNVDNTSDMNKPISNAVSTALGTKAATDHTHSEFARVAAAPATWRWNGTTLPTSASQVHAQARVGDFIVAPNLTTDPGWHQITGV